MWIAISLALAAQDPASEITPDLVGMAGELIGIEYTEEELELLTGKIVEQLQHFEALRGVSLDNGDIPATVFSPLPPGVACRAQALPAAPLSLPQVDRPDDLADLYYASIPTLAHLVRSQQVSCVELCELFLARLEQLDAELHCVISYTRERARAQAESLDRELAEGTWRGLLHGIPWGAKDLLATAGARTTWGAKPYEE
ncbi:MAG: amidase family protein, partial [Planctomycetota bacterium]